MTTTSKNYGFPTGYFSLIYNYLCDNGKLDRDNDKQLIQLFKDFGYPDYIVPYLALEYRGYEFNILDAKCIWNQQEHKQSAATKKDKEGAGNETVEESSNYTSSYQLQDEEDDEQSDGTLRDDNSTLSANDSSSTLRDDSSTLSDLDKSPEGSEESYAE